MAHRRPGRLQHRASVATPSVTRPEGCVGPRRTLGAASSSLCRPPQPPCRRRTGRHDDHRRPHRARRAGRAAMVERPGERPDRVRGPAAVGRAPGDPARSRGLPGVPRRGPGRRPDGRSRRAQVAQEVDAATAERVAELVRRIFGRVLKELSDLDNPMRTMLAVDEAMEREGVLPGFVVPPPPEPADWDAPPVDDRQELEPAFPEIPVDALPPPEPLEPGDPLPPPGRSRGAVDVARPTCRRWRSTPRRATPGAASTTSAASCSTTTATRTSCW